MLSIYIHCLFSVQFFQNTKNIWWKFLIIHLVSNISPTLESTEHLKKFNAYLLDKISESAISPMFKELEKIMDKESPQKIREMLSYKTQNIKKVKEAIKRKLIKILEHKITTNERNSQKIFNNRLSSQKKESTNLKTVFEISKWRT